MNAMEDVSNRRWGDRWARSAFFAADNLPPGDVFFALTPETDATLAAGRSGRWLQATNRLTGLLRPRAVWHVTLVKLGWRPNLSWEVIEAACRAAENITMPPFKIAFDRAASFNRKQGHTRWPLALYGGEGVIGADLLQAELLRELKKIAPRLGRGGHFEPHLTLLYDSRRVTEQPIEPVFWTVRDFVLIYSLHGHTRHIPLGRWTLQAP